MRNFPTNPNPNPVISKKSLTVDPWRMVDGHPPTTTIQGIHKKAHSAMRNALTLTHSL